MKTLNLALAAAISIGFATSAQAINQLQLSIAGGTYNNTTETTVASSNVFTLYAYLTPGNGANVDVPALLADTYYVSMAVAPKTGPADSNLGTFSVGSTTVNVTSDMTYGVPPLEAVLADDQHDLQDHGIFDTFFYEYSFKFDSSMQANPFDVQPKKDVATFIAPTFPVAGAGMYYVGFNIDVTELSKAVSIHFDLYSSALKSCDATGANCDIDINDFAPFSHDAQSGSGGGGGGSGQQEVPEPGPLSLLGLGLMGLWFARRKTNA